MNIRRKIKVDYIKKLENFPISRYKHCYSVGKRMYICKKLGYNEDFCGDMFVLGNIHDIGYELDGNAFRHDEVLADCLSDSIPMILLYFGDMTVDW